MISRRKSREYLLQMLYAQASTGSAFDRDIFFDTYFEPGDTEYLDHAYLTSMESAIRAHESELLAVIHSLAPKFDLETVPLLHVLILMISLTEMHYIEWEKLAESISVNEAIELGKKFSDEQGKGFINGTLSTFLKDRETVLLWAKSVEWHIFVPRSE